MGMGNEMWGVDGRNGGGGKEALAGVVAPIIVGARHWGRWRM